MTDAKVRLNFTEKAKIKAVVVDWTQVKLKLNNLTRWSL